VAPGIARQIEVSARQVCPCVAPRCITRICCPSVAPDRDSTDISSESQRSKWRIYVLFHWLEVVPGGGIEPPTRGFSISLVIRANCLRIGQTVT